MEYVYRLDFNAAELEHPFYDAHGKLGLPAVVRVLSEYVFEYGTYAGDGCLVAIAWNDGSLLRHVKSAEVVNAVDMVSVMVREKHAVEPLKAVPQRLSP